MPDQNVYIPRLQFPTEITVTEGGTTTFELKTGDFSNGDPAGELWTPTGSPVWITPQRFELTPTAPSVNVMISAQPDADANNELILLDFYIWGAAGGESPGTHIRVIDTDAPNIIASPWILPISQTATFDVRLTQPPTAAMTISIEWLDSAYLDVSPAKLSFDATNFSAPQTVTATMREQFGFAETLTLRPSNDLQLGAVILMPSG